MRHRIKQLLAVLTGAAMAAGVAGALSSDAICVFIDDSWAQIDDLGYFADVMNGSYYFDPDDYAVLEKNSDTGYYGTSLVILSDFSYCYTSFQVTDEAQFDEIYAQYADALPFDSVSYQTGSYYTWITLRSSDRASLDASDEVCAVLTEMTADLEACGILQTAKYLPVFAPQTYASCRLYLEVYLPEEDEDALNDVCEEYGTEVAYYGDADAYFDKSKAEQSLESTKNSEKLTDAQKEELYAIYQETIDKYAQQMDEVDPEDCRFGIYTSSFTAQMQLKLAIEDAFPEAVVSFDIDYPESTADIFTSIDLTAMTEDSTETDASEAVGYGDGTWYLIDDHGYCADSDQIGYLLDSGFDADNYYVFEQIPDSEFYGGNLSILSDIVYNFALFSVTDDDLFAQIYEKYADALDFDHVVYGYYPNRDEIILCDSDSSALELSDEKIALLTDLTQELYDQGILDWAQYRKAYAHENYISYQRYLKVSLPYEEYDALNAICDEYGTEVAYYGDVSAFYQVSLDELRIENTMKNDNLSDELKEEHCADLQERVDEYTQKMENVADEDCQFAIFTDNFVTQCALIDAIYDAFPDAQVTYYTESPCSSSMILSGNTIQLSDLVEDHMDNTSVDIICGDVNFDGNINLSDVVVLSKASSGVVDITENMTAAGDIDGDGEISESDSLVLLNFEMGLVRAIPLTNN